MVPLYMVAIASYHSGAHLIKPQFPVNLRTLSQGCHISYNLVTTLPLYTRLLLGCYNLVRLLTGCDNLGISIWVIILIFVSHLHVQWKLIFTCVNSLIIKRIHNIMKVKEYIIKDRESNKRRSQHFCLL